MSLSKSINIIIQFVIWILTSYVAMAQVPVVPGPTTTTTRYIDNKGTITNLSLTNTTIGYIFASGHIDGINPGRGTIKYGLNTNINRTASGRYTITFTTAHPSGGNYPITLGVQEDQGNRDARIIQVVPGTQNANGFRIIILTGDNGTGADPYVDEDWYFSVPATISVVTDVQITTN